MSVDTLTISKEWVWIKVTYARTLYVEFRWLSLVFIGLEEVDVIPTRAPIGILERPNNAHTQAMGRDSFFKEKWSVLSVCQAPEDRHSTSLVFVFPFANLEENPGKHARTEGPGGRTQHEQRARLI